MILSHTGHERVTVMFLYFVFLRGQSPCDRPITCPRIPATIKWKKLLPFSKFYVYSVAGRNRICGMILGKKMCQCLFVYHKSLVH